MTPGSVHAESGSRGTRESLCIPPVCPNYARLLARLKNADTVHGRSPLIHRVLPSANLTQHLPRRILALLLGVHGHT